MSTKMKPTPERVQLVRASTEQLHATETALDLALCEAARLMITTTQGRIDVGLSAVVGLDAFDGMMDLVNNIAHTRRGVVDLHGRFSSVQAQIGCGGVTLTGPDTKPELPPPPPTGQLIELVVDSTKKDSTQAA